MNCDVIQPIQLTKNKDTALPLFLSKIQAGFPSPADDFMDNRLNLNDHIIKNPSQHIMSKSVAIQ